MTVLTRLAEDESYLAALLDDQSGIDLVEFAMQDHTPGRPDSCYRAYDFQWPWWHSRETFQIDQCVAEGTMVLTGRGQLPIERVTAGMYVLTHRQRWRKVTAVMDRGDRQTVRVRTRRDRIGVRVTGEHPFYAAVMRANDAPLGQPGWVDALSLSTKAGSMHCLAIPTHVPPPPVSVPPAADPANWLAREDMWWLAGAFLVAGYFDGTSLVYDGRYPEEILRRLNRMAPDLPVTVLGSLREGGRDRLCVVSAELVTLMRAVIGNGIHPLAYAPRHGEALLDALRQLSIPFAGGAKLLTDARTARAVMLMASVVGQQVLITGRRGRDRVRAWTHEVEISRRRIMGRFEDGLQWVPVTEVVPDGMAQCWDLEVEEDHSFLADGHFVHNCSRSVGKSESILARATAFPFCFPGQEMLLTAPELNHLDPLTSKVEDRFLRGPRLFRAMLPTQKGGGIRHQPQFQATFITGARIVGRLPQRDGKGVKGSLGAGALVLTKEGQVPIEDLDVGDEVWTHMERWRPVEHTVAYFNEDVVAVAGGGHRALVMSSNHRMYLRRASGGHRTKKLERPAFLLPAQQEDTHFHLGTPTRLPVGLEVPDWANAQTAWLAGRYVAGGSHADRGGPLGRVHFPTPAAQLGQVQLRIIAAGFTSAAVRRRGDGYDVQVTSVELARALHADFGRLSTGKRLPTWLLGADAPLREAFLAGYLSGDGHWDETRGRWALTSTSKELIIGLLLLGSTLGYGTSYSWTGPSAKARRMHSGTLSRAGRYSLVEDHIAWRKVRKVSPAQPQMVYDIHVKDDHSYLADGLISHNQHPLRLEMDESQDYPQAGWMEIIETMKAGVPGAQWRSHGVSRGVRDMYYKMTMGDNPDVPFYVHRYPAMFRPLWSGEERKQKVAIYGGSRDNPDYKRNIYGEHGDASNRVFVLARLMACVRIHESTWADEYNDNVYYSPRIEGEILTQATPIESLLRFPAIHLLKDYTSFWAGMDIGFTSDPSELLVFGQISQNIAGQKVDVLRLLSRIHLMRVSAPDQERVIEAVLDFYGPRFRHLSMDRTGAGLPIWQHMDGKPAVRAKIKGYGFSEKGAVMLDEHELRAGEAGGEAVIEKNLIAFATDKLRSYVDARMIELPYDQTLLTEFQGQTVQYTRDEGARVTNAKFGGGSFHTLDAAKLMVLGKEMEAMEELERRKGQHDPVLDVFADQSSYISADEGTDFFGF